MSFPHAKANCYDAGLHVPLAVCWGERIRPRQVVESLVSLVDVFPTLLEASGVTYGADSVLVGESLLPLLEDRAGEYDSEAVYAGRERHSCSRYDNLGYPMRSIRSATTCWCAISIPSAGRRAIRRRSTRKAARRRCTAPTTTSTQPRRRLI